MIQGPGSVAHKWTVVFEVFKQAHLPPSSGDHLQQARALIKCNGPYDLYRMQEEAAELRLTVSSGWYQDRRAF